MEAMADVYTPTKAMDGTCLIESNLEESPDTYIPTRISELTRKSEETPSKEETTRQKYGSSVSDTYSPSNPGIRIVKRKPNLTKPNEAAANSTPSTSLGKRPAADDTNDPALAALKMTPSKSNLRDTNASLTKRPTRRIFFADSRGLPLCLVKEVEKLTVHHSNFEDYRQIEKNEALFGRTKYLEEVEWALVPVKGVRDRKFKQSESAKKEEKRVADLGLMRGPIFQICDVIDDPSLSDLAAGNFAMSTPIMIPVEASSSESSRNISALHDLPLPGRAPNLNANPNMLLMISPNQPNQYNNPSTNHPDSTTGISNGNTHEASKTSAPPLNGPIIKQIFEEAEPVGNTYYGKPEYSSSVTNVNSSITSKIEIPANLKEILDKLKQKGFVSQDSSTSAPVVDSPFAAAMQTAQQMYQSQQDDNDGNIYFGTMDNVRHDYAPRNDGWKHGRKNEVCDFFVNRPSGCNKGDQCRFVHDEDMRRRRQEERNAFHRDREERGFRPGNNRGRGSYRGGFRQNQPRGGQHNMNRVESYANVPTSFPTPPPPHGQSAQSFGSTPSPSSTNVPPTHGISNVAHPQNHVTSSATLIQQQQLIAQTPVAFAKFQVPPPTTAVLAPSSSGTSNAYQANDLANDANSKRRSRFDQVNQFSNDVDERPRRGRQTRFDAPARQDQDDRHVYNNYN